MEKSYLQAIQKEKSSRTLRASLLGFLTVFLLLMISQLLFPLVSIGIPDLSNSDDVPYKPVENSSYTLDLSTAITEKWEQKAISHISVTGNASYSINETLFDSEISWNEDLNLWNASSRLINHTDGWAIDSVNHTFSFEPINVLFDSFLTGLANSFEVEPSSIFPEGSVPNLLLFNIFFEDGSGIHFEWLGFQAVHHINTMSFTWDIQDEMLVIDSDVDSKRHIAPISAFDPFILQLRELYASVIHDYLNPDIVR